MSVPEDLQYTKSHEWVRTEGDTATIGITDHAQDELDAWRLAFQQALAQVRHDEGLDWNAEIDLGL